MSLQQCRDNLAHKLQGFDPGPRCPLPIEARLASSLLQKALRRADHSHARRAACRLAEIDPDRLWRRLTAIVFEDFGLASPESTQAVVAAAADKGWRKRVGGDVKVASFLVDLLVEYPRDRRVDELYMLAVRLSEDKVSAIPIPDLGGSPTLSRLIQEAVVIVQRCEQADRYRNLRIVRAKACDAVLGGLLEQGGVDEELFETCLQGRRSSRCLLPVLLPLWNLASEGVPQQMVERLVPPSIAIGGIPAYAIDGYTAPGRVALARLGRLDSRLTRITSILSTPQKRLACLTSLLFVVEGGICSQELSDPLYEELKASSLGCWTGLSRRVLPQALEAMRIALPLLDQLRDEVLGDGV